MGGGIGFGGQRVGLGCGIAEGGGDALVEEVVGEAVLEVIGWVRWEG